MNRLRYFCMIVQSGSLARAAEFLGISAAALSKSMRIFEEETGIELLRASGRGVVVTAEGKRLAERGHKLLEEMALLTQYASGHLTERRQLRIGTFEVFSTYFIGEIISEFNKDDLDLFMHELTPGKIEQALLDQKIDLGLSYMAVPHNDLDHLEIGKVRMGIYGLQGKFNKFKIAELPFVIPIEPLVGTPTKAQGLDGWQPAFGPRNVRFRVTLMESALEITRKGLAVSYLPSFVAELHNNYVTAEYKLKEIQFETKNNRTNPVYLIKRKDQKESQSMKKIAKVMRRILI